MNNSTIWQGVVEDRKDPLQLGRCRIRILGYHTDNRSISKLPIGDLPWAYPAQPITSSAMSGVGQTPLGPVEGTWVIGYFRDGEDAQQPVFFATLGGIPQELADNGKGFNAPIDPRDEMAVLAEFGAKSVDELSANDRSRYDLRINETAPRFPRKSHLNEPDTNRLARLGYDDLETLVSKNDSKKSMTICIKKNSKLKKTPIWKRFTTERIPIEEIAMLLDTFDPDELDKNIRLKYPRDLDSFVSIANSPRSSSDPRKNTFSEPKTSYEAAYPYNHVYESESGHIFEVDDTKGAERLHRYHRAGTFEEIQPDGTRVLKIKGKNYTIIVKNNHVHIQGGAYVTVDGNLCEYVKGNVNRQVGGNLTEVVEGSVKRTVGVSESVTIGGNYTQTVGNNINISANGKDVKINGTMIDIKANNKLTLQGLGTKGVEVITGGQFNITQGTSFLPGGLGGALLGKALSAVGPLGGLAKAALAGAAVMPHLGPLVAGVAAIKGGLPGSLGGMVGKMTKAMDGGVLGAISGGPLSAISGGALSGGILGGITGATTDAFGEAFADIAKNIPTLDLGGMSEEFQNIAGEATKMLGDMIPGAPLEDLQKVGGFLANPILNAANGHGATAVSEAILGRVADSFDVVNTIGKGVTAAGKNIIDGVTGITKEAIGAGIDVGSALTDATHNATEMVRNVTDLPGNIANKFAEGAVGGIGKSIENVGQNVGAVLTDVTKRADGIVQSLAPIQKAAENTSIGGVITNAVNNVADAAYGIVNDVGKEAGKILKSLDMENDEKGSLHPAGNIPSENIINNIGKGIGDFGKVIDRTAKGVASGIVGVADKTFGTIGKAVEGVQGGLENLGKKTDEFVDEFEGSVEEGIISDRPDFGNELKGNMIAPLATAGVALGAGLEDLTAGVTDAVGGIASDLLSPIAGPIGDIGSMIADTTDLITGAINSVWDFAGSLDMIVSGVLDLLPGSTNIEFLK